MKENYFKGITDPMGNPLSEDNINPLMGYRIINRYSGRLLPGTQDCEIMGKDYATRKYQSIIKAYRVMNEPLCVNDYELEPMYFKDLEEEPYNSLGFFLLYTKKDQKDMHLFDGDDNVQLPTDESLLKKVLVLMKKMYKSGNL